MTDFKADLLAGLKRVSGPPVKLPARYDSLTPQQRYYVREAYDRLQDGLCWYCHEPLAGKPLKTVASKRLNRKVFPVGFFDHPVHLHHDHDTGLTIGTTHAICNAVLWTYHRQ